MGSCAAPSAKGDDKFITTDYLQQCPLYESRLKGKLHVISKRYTQRIERHNLNLRQHLARLGRKSLSFSKSVELHDKVIGHYLNIKHYQ
uniref:TnpA n=1 Tax=Pseudomonas aeruginosa TaxID=287 RepID=A0A2U8T0J0_PSEAI|nr:TnpA [Pseudomonas aeruginosa]